MAALHAQNRTYRYVSGWCEGALHKRCKGSYAGTACSCACHVKAAPDRAEASA